MRGTIHHLNWARQRRNRPKTPLERSWPHYLAVRLTVLKVCVFSHFFERSFGVGPPGLRLYFESRLSGSISPGRRGTNDVKTYGQVFWLTQPVPHLSSRGGADSPLWPRERSYRGPKPLIALGMAGADQGWGPNAAGRGPDHLASSI